MKNKNGFTLVELLAVIVILAVIILIAVTAVIPRMNSAKKNAFVDEALMYLNAGREIYVSQEGAECYNIEDLGNYVSQQKSGYTGTLYVNGSRISLNLTNGKFYIKGDNTRVLQLDDVENSAPDDFIPSCSDTSKSYSITYNLNGGTLASANPSSYNVNTPTFVLNTPTKSGYRFVGWSGGKNLFNNGEEPEAAGKYIKGAGNRITNSEFSIYKAPVKPNTEYIIKYSGLSGSAGYALFDSSNTYITGEGYQSRTEITFTTPSNASYILFSIVTQESSSRYDMDTYQIEEGSTITEYEKHINQSASLSVTRGSSGNRTYTAIWEAI